MTISMHPVKSSHIAEVGHSDTTLRVKFRDGTVHDFHDVPSVLFEEGLKAESIGKWLHSRIKGKHRHDKIEG